MTYVEYTKVEQKRHIKHEDDQCRVLFEIYLFKVLQDIKLIKNLEICTVRKTGKTLGLALELLPSLCA